MNNPPKEIWINEGDDSGDIRGGTWSTRNYLFSAGPYNPKPKPILKWERVEKNRIKAVYKGYEFNVFNYGVFVLEVYNPTASKKTISLKTQRTAKQVAEAIAGEL